MNKRYWIENLPGMPDLSNPKIGGLGGHCDLKGANCWLIEKGHFVEYLILPGMRYTTVALFFKPGEILIRSHPQYSIFEALDDTTVTEFSHRDMFRTLREFPEAAELYRASKLKYEEKVRRRLEFAWLASDEQRFNRLQDRESWVLEKAPCEIVAGYLTVTPARLRELNQMYKH